jgi:hypothetical protein
MLLAVRLGLLLTLGPCVSVSPSLSLELSGSVDHCKETEGWGGEGIAAGSLTAGFRAETAAAVCGNSIFAKGKGSFTTAVKGILSSNSVTGADNKVCVDDLTGDIISLY